MSANVALLRISAHFVLCFALDGHSILCHSDKQLQATKNRDIHVVWCCWWNFHIYSIFMAVHIASVKKRNNYPVS